MSPTKNNGDSAFSAPKGDPAENGCGDLGSGTSQSPPEDRETRRQLDACAEQANRALSTSCDKVHEALEYARRCGEALNKAKNLLPHGELGKWLAQNFQGS